MFEAARQDGAGPDLWIAPGTHAFDAPGHDGFPSPMRYDPELAEGCQGRFLAFLHRTLGGLPAALAELPRTMEA